MAPDRLLAMEIVVMAVLGLLVAVYVLVPVQSSSRVVAYDWDGTGASELRSDRRTELEADVRLYREALRAGTLCENCSFANGDGSRFCAECGRPLPASRREETEPEPVSG